MLKAFLKENNVPSAAADVIIDKLKGSTIPSKLTTGSLTFEMSTAGLEALKMKITYNLLKVDNKTLSGECSMTLEVDLYPIDYVKEKVPAVIEGVVESTLKKLGPGLTIGIAVVIIVACFVVVSSELLIDAIVTFLTAYIPQLLS